MEAPALAIGESSCRSALVGSLKIFSYIEMLLDHPIPTAFFLLSRKFYFCINRILCKIGKEAEFKFTKSRSFCGGRMMVIRIGQKVAYPNHGVCQVEAIEDKQVGDVFEKFYMLRVISNNSSILVPKSKVEEIGIRPIINSVQCQDLMKFLSEDFEDPPSDWKIRSKQFHTKIQTGNIFEVADVLKKLYFLSRLKPLSFRDQRMFEKTKFLVISEMAIVCSQPECKVEERVCELLEMSYQKHIGSGFKATASTAIH